MDFAEQRYLHTRIELEKLIAYMKQRDTKFNIKQMRDDYDQILSLMTGKKKQVSLYEIKKQMENEENQEAKSKQESNILDLENESSTQVPLLNKDTSGKDITSLKKANGQQSLKEHSGEGEVEKIPS